jgi:hypothetical protein
MQVNHCHNLPSNSGMIAVIVPARRFPPPWSVEEQDACFVVKDAAGQKLQGRDGLGR